MKTAATLTAIFLAITPCLVLAAAPTSGPKPGVHLLVTLELEGTTLRILAVQAVAQPLPKQRGGEASAPALPWRVRLLGPAGAVLHTRGLADPTELRVEFTDEPAGKIRGQRVLRSGPAVFCVRVPLAAGTLSIERVDPARAREAKPAEEAWQLVGAVELAGVAP